MSNDRGSSGAGRAVMLPIAIFGGIATMLWGLVGAIFALVTAIGFGYVLGSGRRRGVRA